MRSSNKKQIAEMKKLFYSFAVLALLASSLCFTSCDDKIISSEDKIDTSRTATVVFSFGIVKSDAADAKAEAMSGQTKIILKAGYSDVYGKNEADVFTREVVVTGQNQSVELPVGAKKSGATTYTIVYSTFVDKYTISAKNETHDCVYKVDKKGTATVSLTPGEVQHIEVKYVSDGKKFNVE